jgi:hypothetical protein
MMPTMPPASDRGNGLAEMGTSVAHDQASGVSTP